MKPTLNQYLASIRHDRKMSLRQVEEASGKEVSNAYLSQLETGKIQQPSPTVLKRLAEIYQIDHMQLMGLAGYLPDAPTKSASTALRSQKIGAFSEHNLTEDEEAKLIDYLQFLRSKKRS